MSNDLISRNDVLLILEKVFKEYRISWGKSSGGFAAAVPNAIENIPTAYDTDNKVRQLEAWKEKQLAIADREIAESDSELRKGIIKELKAITDACIENSIEIVKGGQNERSVESC